MPNTRRSTALEFERTPLADLRQGRRGKHHDLMKTIAGEIDALPDGQAVKLPLESVELSLPNLRSAVTRAMTARGVKIGTFCDGRNLFVWKKTARTARYERKPRRTRRGKAS